MTSLMNYPLELIYCDWHDCTQLTEIKNRKAIAKKISSFCTNISSARVYEKWPFSVANKQATKKRKVNKKHLTWMTSDRNRRRKECENKHMSVLNSTKCSIRCTTPWQTPYRSLSLTHTRTYTHTLTHTHSHALTLTLTNNLSFLLFSDLLPPPTLNGLYVYFLLLTLPFSDNCNIIVYLSVIQTNFYTSDS